MRWIHLLLLQQEMEAEGRYRKNGHLQVKTKIFLLNQEVPKQK